MSQSSQCLGLCAFGNISRPIVWPKFLRLVLKLFMRQNSFHLSGMLFIVGHIWRSWETKLFETTTKSKVFETNTTTFSRTNFFGSLLRLFLDQNFWDRYRAFFETKVFETDTETFFRDQIFSRPIPRLFSRLNIF